MLFVLFGREADGHTYQSYAIGFAGVLSIMEQGSIRDIVLVPLPGRYY